MPKGTSVDMNIYLRTLYTLTGNRDNTTMITRYLNATAGDKTKAFLTLLAAAKT